jgi:hypothetical protein
MASNRLKSLDCEKARANVKPFLERDRDLDLLKKGLLISHL